MKTTVLTVSLNPSIDKTVCVGQFGLGQELRAKAVRISAGGKAVNVARALRMLGIKAGVWGIAGGLTGHKLAEFLEAEALIQDWIWTVGETRTNLTVLEQSTGRATRILEPGPPVGKRLLKMVREDFLHKLSVLNVVIFAGSLPPGMPPRMLAELIRRAREVNVLTVLDASGEALAEGIKARPFLVKPNRAEAEDVCGFRIRGRSGMRKALQHLSKQSNIVLISLGEEGLIVSDTVRMFWAHGPVIRQGLAVGCGDAALAGFLSGFLKGDSLEDCLRLSVACGTANIDADTPGDIRRRRIEDIHSKIAVERL